MPFLLTIDATVGCRRRNGRYRPTVATIVCPTLPDCSKSSMSLVSVASKPVPPITKVTADSESRSWDVGRCQKRGNDQLHCNERDDARVKLSGYLMDCKTCAE
jgi:hypothetical protein